MIKYRKKTTATLLITIFMISTMAFTVPIVTVSANPGHDFSGYTLPSVFDTTVTNTAELETAVSNGVANVILVLAGTYEPTWGGGKGLLIKDSDKLYAEFAPDSVNPSVIEGGTAPLSSGLTGVTISGFDIRNGGISGAASCELSYNMISTSGIGMYLGSNNLVTNNEILGSGDPEDAGIHIAGSGNTVEYNTIKGFTKGEVSGYIHGKKGAGIVVCYGADDTTIRNNVITGNTIGVMVYIPDRVGLTSPTNVVVNNNDIEDNTDYGVFNAKCPGSNFPSWFYWEYDKYTPADSTVDATLNWWGSNTGPHHPDTNLLGEGNAVSDNVLYKPWTKIVEPIQATVDINPDTLNVKSHGQWITAQIELPVGYDVSDIDIASIVLTTEFGGTFSVDLDAPTAIDPKLMVKFDREALVGYLGRPDLDGIDGLKFYDVTLTVTGTLLDGTPFAGTDTIKVIRK